jgi:hypothetical protein
MTYTLFNLQYINYRRLIFWFCFLFLYLQLHTNTNQDQTKPYEKKKQKQKQAKTLQFRILSWFDDVGFVPRSTM